MRGIGTGKNDAMIDWVCPVNWLAPLNRGLAGWWLAVPGAMGGSRWPDLCRLNDGTLSNMDPQSDWRSEIPQRPGGFGYLDFDGSNDFVSVPTRGFPAIDAAKTISLWLYQTGTASVKYIAFALVKDDTSGANNSVDIRVNASNSEVLVTKWGATNLVAGGNNSFNASGTFLWHHVTYTFDGTNHTIFVDGRYVATATTAGNSGATGICRIGSFNSAFPTPYWLRLIDDVRLWNRCLSAAEVAFLYHASRTGYQAELRRLPRVAAWEQAAAFDPATFPYSKLERQHDRPVSVVAF